MLPFFTYQIKITIIIKYLNTVRLRFKLSFFKEKNKLKYSNIHSMISALENLMKNFETPPLCFECGIDPFILFFF